jgi:hypothetical protein
MTRASRGRAQVARGLFACAAAATFAAAAHAAPTAVQVAELCANAEDQAHCGRLIEEVQMKRLPGMVERTGDELRVTLFPTGSVAFRDSVALTGAKTYTLWDYLDRINAIVLFTTDGEQSGFLVLQRANGKQFRLPSEPTLSPDRQYLVTADFCASGCDGELAVWRVTRDEVRKMLAWKPGAAWIDANATWKDPDTLRVEYTLAPEEKLRTLERRLDAPGWQRP